MEGTGGVGFEGGWEGCLRAGVGADLARGVICHHPRNLVLAHRQQRIAHLWLNIF